MQGTLFARGLGWVDFDFDFSTVCQILLGLMAIWQIQLGKMVELEYDRKNCGQSFGRKSLSVAAATAPPLRYYGRKRIAAERAYFGRKKPYGSKL